MQRPINWWLFWGSIGTIVYTYLGFPLVLAVRGLIWPRPVKRNTTTPLVSIIIAAYNEASVIVKKLDNTFALEYPESQMEVIVASDGSNDNTNELVAGYSKPVKLLELPRQGKNRTLNAAVAAAKGEILVFSDADSMLTPDALQQLVAPFSDPQVGGVGGDFRYTSKTGEGTGERTYWNVDRILKQLQSRAGNMTSATGQIYAVRRELFQPVPIDVTDDSYTSLQVVAAHRRLVFEQNAVAYGPVAASAQGEFKRKVRVITRGLTSVWRMRRLLNPFEYGFFSIQLFSHKVLRRLVAIPLLLISISAPTLWGRGLFYKAVTLSQLGLHSAGLLGFLAQGSRLGQLKVLSLPFFFEMVNIAALLAAINVVRGKRHAVWVPQRHPADQDKTPGRFDQPQEEIVAHL
jgi:cellulose synthase/poly-beta-1,6-N-acetylglucosamine synthase-like glycosyltransferase